MAINENDVQLKWVGEGTLSLEKLQPGDYILYIRDTAGNAIAKLELKEMVLKISKNDIVSEEKWSDKNTIPELIRICSLKFEELSPPLNVIKISPR